MRYDYAGGVLPHERPTVERFEADVLPYIERHGGRIGEMAMAGDLDCEEVIRRYRQFVQGDPSYRRQCLAAMVDALKRVERTLQ